MFGIGFAVVNQWGGHRVHPVGCTMAPINDRRRGFAATVRRKSFSSKEKQIWLIRGKKTKAKGKNRKRPSLV